MYSRDTNVRNNSLSLDRVSLNKQRDLLLVNTKDRFAPFNVNVSLKQQKTSAFLFCGVKNQQASIPNPEVQRS